MWQTILIVSLGILVAILGAGALWMGYKYLHRDTISQRLESYVADPMTETIQRPHVRIQTRRLTGSFSTRTFTPVIKKIGHALGRLTPAGAIGNLSHQLLVAGNPYGLGPREFFGLSVASTVVGFLLAIVVIRRGLDPLNIVLSLLIFVFLAALPTLWLRMRIQQRQNRVRKGLPDALDMISVCATAGLGFDQSLQRVSEHWDTPVGQEFGRVISEMEMGLARRDALRNLADRLDIREISSFVALIIQTEQLGMSISDTLHAQADQMRIERRFRAQEQAQKAPTKMLIPMAFLIFPALLAVILGPAIPALIEVFKNF
ncbi:MAG TPA: type II secretion system F family protein [Anaerolineales bacterium]|nr:type II secretion system F family protein [Anaerolineales bacterium]